MRERKASLGPRTQRTSSNQEEDFNSLNSPKLLIIGTQKGGTGALSTFLELHPSFRRSSASEPSFFNKKYALGSKWYLNQWAHALGEKHVINFEKSPGYINSLEAPARIREMLGPEVKFILLLRNPAGRAYSHYRLMTEVFWKRVSKRFASFAASDSDCMQRLCGESNFPWGYELDGKLPRPSFEEMLADVAPSLAAKYFAESVSILGERGTPTCYRRCLRGEGKQWNGILSRGLYAQHIRHWQKYIDLKQMLILKTEDLYFDPIRILSLIQDFMKPQLSHTIDFSALLLRTEDGHYTIKNRQDSTKADQHRRAMEGSVDIVARNAKGFGPQTKAFLEEFYRNSTEELYEILGERLWEEGYTAVYTSQMRTLVKENKA